MSRSSGLRNKNRPNGRSTYARMGKHSTRDRYGKWENGRQIHGDVIAGRNRPLHQEDMKRNRREVVNV